MLISKLVKGFLMMSVVALVHIRGEQLEADAVLATDGGEERVIYDQRQNGKYNIHVVIKDVAIIEMDRNEIENVDYGNDDYYYDENDLTVNPITLNPPVPTTKLSTANIGIEPTRKKSSTTYKTTSQDSSITTIAPRGDDHIESTKILNITNDETTEAIATSENTSSRNAYPLPTIRQTLQRKPSVPKESIEIKQLPLSSPTELRPRSKVEPIFALDEAQLHSKSKIISHTLTKDAKAAAMKNSKMYEVKIHRSHQPYNYSPLRVQSRRCRSNQFRDNRGNCRSQRSPSGSLLKRLFGMLITLPFVRGEHLDENL